MSLHQDLRSIMSIHHLLHISGNGQSFQSQIRIILQRRCIEGAGGTGGLLTKINISLRRDDGLGITVQVDERVIFIAVKINIVTGCDSGIRIVLQRQKRET